MVSVLNHVYRCPGTPEYHHLSNRGRFLQSLVDRGLQWNLRSPPECLVLRYYSNGLRVVSAVAQRVGGKSAENH